MEILYVKKFSNGKMYVGITDNFNRRMTKHNYAAYVLNSQMAVHRAIRKHEHETEVWAEIDDRELILELEKQTIAQLKEAGIKLYNMTEGGDGSTGRLHTEDTKAKLKEAWINRSDRVETATKQCLINSKKNKKPVLQLDEEGELIKKWDSSADAERELGIQGVNKVCNGKRKTCGGFRWCFA